ncbi:major facilitator superfamily transporter [Colletotrichum graminicola M1.001]|uniref:Major facilitator superfamily transporter n=1 Tax=Colletotrichum graminicola (strain M1.001 / M2 / FGSC 10212) TaxID=645133 RepID=E3QYL6_COLGM|nr:major facilitator superfamily transporter [Colletotrichum graminicola M1.001]EFQ35954.1 major facilitator superfamily transporter [Colletotrichum graminicola M1.001]
MNTINRRSVEPTDAGICTRDSSKTEPLRDKNAEAILEHTEQASDEEKTAQHLPRVTAPIEALGLENWQDLEKKLVKRLDMTLMPMLWVLYLFNYLDRASISQARLSSFEADLGLTDTQFATAVAVLVPGYIAAQIPSNMILPYVRPSLYLPCCAIVWSGVSASMAGVRNYNGLVACRVILGLCEAPLLPGAIYLMSCWYTRKEIALRTAILYTGLVLAMASSGLIATGVYEGLEGSQGMAGWQWLFIVLAIAGSCCALVATVLLPDYPHSKTGSARWSLTEDMRLLAVARIQADRVSLPQANSTSIWYGLKLTCMDYKTWIFVAINISISAAYGFLNFFPSIVRGFGFESRTTTLLLTAPPYVFAAVASLCNARSSDHFKERGYHMIGPVIAAILGYIVCTATGNVPARYAASFLYIGVGTLGRTPEKRATAIPVINVLGQIGNVIAPYFFPDRDEPRYLMAFLLMMGFAAIGVAFCLLLKFCLIRSNKKLWAKAQEDGTAYNPYTL